MDLLLNQFKAAAQEYYYMDNGYVMFEIGREEGNEQP